MKKLLTILFLVLLFSVKGNAQLNIGDIKGVISFSGEVVVGATIELHSVNDRIVSTNSDTAGKYIIDQLPAGEYQLKTTTIGFKPVNDKVIIKAGVTTTYNITLISSAKILEAVSVVSQRKPIEIKADKTVINVDASPVNNGGTALEILEKSPGVTVDNDGNISLAGKTGVNVMIDGKPTQMSGADLANYLRGLPASQLDQVELITQPSSKFDAEGNAGIINLKFKKNKLKGLNGSLGTSYSQGKYGRKIGNGFIGYRTGKWNLYFNMSNMLSEGFNDMHVVRYFRTKGSNQLVSIFDQSTFLKIKNHNNNASFDVDYLLSSKTTIGVKVKNSFSDIDFNLPTLLKIYSETKVYTGKAVTNGTNELDNRNLTINVNLKSDLDSQGRQISVDADYARFYSNSKQQLNNYFYDADGVENAAPYLLRGINPSLFHIWSAKADYILPLAKKYKIEAGVKTSFVTSDNNAAFENKNSGTWQNDPRSNYFSYKENINAAYITSSKSWEKLQLQTGLRLENTIAAGNQRTTNQKFNRNYTQLFPTLFASYQFNEKHAVNLNLGRRIRRPDYDALNPFQMLLNPYTYQQGNPLLQPQFSINGELGYIFRDGLLNTKLSYSKTKNIISDVLTQDEVTFVSYVKPENLAKQEDLQLQLGTNTKLKKWWTINANLYGNYIHFNGMLNGYMHELHFYSFSANMLNQFKLKQGWSAEISGFYRYKNLFSRNSIIKPMGQLNAGISKEILNKKGTIKLNVKDIFRTAKFQVDQQYHEFESYFTNRYDSRTVAIGFTWRFAKNEKNVLKQRATGASADEQSRTGKN